MECRRVSRHSRTSERVRRLLHNRSLDAIRVLRRLRACSRPQRQKHEMGSRRCAAHGAQARDGVRATSPPPEARHVPTRACCNGTRLSGGSGNGHPPTPRWRRGGPGVAHADPPPLPWSVKKPNLEMPAGPCASAKARSRARNMAIWRHALGPSTNPAPVRGVVAGGWGRRRRCDKGTWRGGWGGVERECGCAGGGFGVG